MYPQVIQNSESWLRWQQQKQLTTEFTGVDPELLSFDYKMRHPVLNKPSWLPKRMMESMRQTLLTQMA